MMWFKKKHEGNQINVVEEHYVPAFLPTYGLALETFVTSDLFCFGKVDGFDITMGNGGKDRSREELVTSEVVGSKFGSTGYDPLTGFVMNVKIVDDLNPYYGNLIKWKININFITRF